MKQLTDEQYLALSKAYWALRDVYVNNRDIRQMTSVESVVDDVCRLLPDIPYPWNPLAKK